MNCQEVKERLPGLIDEELAAGELAEVEKHIADCEECQAEKRRQEQFTTRVKTSLEDLRPSELFVKGVLDKLGDPAKKKQEQQAAARRTKISLIAAGAVIVAVLVAAWIHAAVTKGGGKDVVATVTGQRKAWLITKGKNGEVKSELPLHIPVGGKVRTEAGGKVVMKLTGGGELTLHEKSTVRLNPDIFLDSGAVSVVASQNGRFAKVGNVGVQVNPGARVQISLQYGDIVVVKVEDGTVGILGAEKHGGWTGGQECLAGEVWKAPADSSREPEKVE